MSVRTKSERGPIEHIGRTCEWTRGNIFFSSETSTSSRVPSLLFVCTLCGQTWDVVLASFAPRFGPLPTRGDAQSTPVQSLLQLVAWTLSPAVRFPLQLRLLLKVLSLPAFLTRPCAPWGQKQVWLKGRTHVVEAGRKLTLRTACFPSFLPSQMATSDWALPRATC